MKKRNMFFLLIIIFLISTSIYLVYRYKSIPEAVSDFQNLLYQYDDFEEELPVHFSDDCSEHEKNVSYISHDQAIEDIDVLFSLLKFGYSGYNYFGGDQVFYNAKDQMLSQIKEIESQDIPRALLATIIHFNLDFIQDSHFAVDGNKLCEYTKYFSSSKYTFHKDFKGFYTYIDDKIYYLTKVNNNEDV